jgi:two-component system sensor histidine kinase PilS (NtrC family)
MKLNVQQVLKRAPGWFGASPSAEEQVGLQWFLLGRLGVLGVILLFLTAFQILRPGILGSKSVVLALFLICLFFAINLFQAVILERTSDHWIAAFLNILLDNLGVSGWVYFNYQSSDPAVLLYLVLILIASLSYHQRGAIFAAVLSCLSYGIVSWLAGQGSDASILAVSVYSAIFITIGFVGGYLSEQLRNANRGLKEKNQEIEKLTQLYERIVEGMPTGLLTIDREKKVGFLNPGAEQILGKNKSLLLGKHLSEVEADLLPFFEQIESQKIEDESDDTPQPGIETELTATGTDWHRSVFLKARLHKGQARLQQTVEIGTGKNRRLLRGDVAEIEVSPGVGSLFGQSEGGGRVLLFQDVTKLVHLEDKLKQHEKLAAVGQLAAGIAHEIRNPLASMSASIQMLRTGLSDSSLGSEDKRLMEIVSKEIDRLNGLITEFLGFVKPDSFKSQPVDLERMLTEIVVQAKNTQAFLSGVQIKTTFSSKLFAYGNEERLKQVAWNLLTNAVQAMKSAGVIELGCEELSPHWVCFWVRDEGEGMTEEVLQHLYEPFFTTKDKGTGLGLATVYKIVEAHQGEIRVQSKPGKGTRFEVHLHRG